MKNLEIVSTKVNGSLEGMSKLRSLLGKRVYSKSGEYVGCVKDFLEKNNELSGILVSGKSRVFFDKEYFTFNSDQSIILKIDPVLTLLGKIVFDKAGRRLGKVVELERKGNTNTYEALLVKKGFLFSKPFRIAKSEIAVSKENVILNVKHAVKKE